MDKVFSDVLDFHKKFCPHLIGTMPKMPSVELQEMRYALIREEFHELFDALIVDDLPGVGDACVDLIYVVAGLAISHGIDLRPLWDEVQRANMAKEGGGTREDGKILKPAGWQPPDIEGLLAKQQPIT